MNAGKFSKQNNITNYWRSVMQKFKKLDSEDWVVSEQGLREFAFPLREIESDTDEDKTIFNHNYLINVNPHEFNSLEHSLERLATGWNGQEVIKKCIVAKYNDREKDAKAHYEYQKFINSWLGVFVRNLPNFIDQISNLSNEYTFSIHIETFRAFCRDRNFWLDEFFLNNFCKKPSAYYYAYGEENGEQARVFINDFFNDLRARLRDPKTRREVLRARKSAENNAKEYCKYVRDLFAARTPINVIRIDLSYKKNIQVDIKDMIRDLQHFHGNMRHKPTLFKGLLGYIERIEYGLNRGFHSHVMLFFSSERQSNADVYLAEEIGRYWVDQITDGKGSYWNVNANKKHFEESRRLGIGEIHAHDEESIIHLCHIVTYMCKVEQFIKPLASPKTKLLRRGKMPKLTHPKRGRPRNIEQKSIPTNDNVIFFPRTNTTNSKD